MLDVVYYAPREVLVMSNSGFNKKKIGYVVDVVNVESKIEKTIYKNNLPEETQTSFKVHFIKDRNSNVIVLNNTEVQFCSTDFSECKKYVDEQNKLIFENFKKYQQPDSDDYSEIDLQKYKVILSSLQKEIDSDLNLTYHQSI